MTQSDPAVTVRDAVQRLIQEYDLQDYASQFNEVAPRAVVAAMNEGKSSRQIVQAAKVEQRGSSPIYNPCNPRFWMPMTI